MAGLRGVFVFSNTLLLLLALTIGSALCQPPTGGANQSQFVQNNQTGQQGTQAGGQMQQSPGGPQGLGQRQMQSTEEMQTMIAQNLKQLLGSTDEEWAVIGPKANKVYTLASSQSTGFNMRNLMRRNTAQGDAQGNSQNQTNTQGNMQQGRGMDNRSLGAGGDTALAELQTLLESEDATTTQIKNKISEVRNAREKARQELAKAQKELRELLTIKQEATLISLGLLE
jgi:hypothetical protein